MNMDNRRLRELQREIKEYYDALDKADSIEECLIYQGKIEILEKEEKEILAKCDVRV